MAAPEEEDDGPSEVEEADIEALARAGLQPGESILGEGVPKEKVVSRGICNKPLLLSKLGEIEYKVPEGAKRVPWIDTLTIDGSTTLPKSAKPKDGVKLETEFLALAADAVKEAYRRLRVMRVPCTRPDDFYAEMLRPDKVMFKVRERAAEEQRRIKIVEDRKKSQAAKKFSKKAKSKKLKVKADEKRKTLNEIADWRKQTKEQKNRDAGEKDLDTILNRQAHQQAKAKVKKDLPKRSKKREAYDKKFGYGGKKKPMKSNSRESTNDFTKSPWYKAPKGKGQGKGKGKGKSKGGFNSKKRRR